MQDFGERRRSRKKPMRKFFFLIVLIILIVGGLGAWWINGTSPENPANTSTQTFEVTQGEDVRGIANNLKTQGLIKDPIIFYLLIKQENIGGKIQAGQFKVSSSMSASEIAQVLQVAKDDVTITVPEGKRAEEVAQILQAHFPRYQVSWTQQLISNEGYLFPDTYAFNKNTDITNIIQTMRDNFNKKYASITDGRKSSLSEAQIVTIASIVEREAKFSQDRPLVASVILNRLSSGMPLQVDATVQYAVGTSSNWWPTLTDSGGNIDPSSPYNSYTNNGLPPSPISNPGLESLKAVIDAPQTKYFFYISDKSGHNHYETTYDQQQQDIQKYGLAN
jgi:UPF0755 protein